MCINPHAFSFGQNHTRLFITQRIVPSDRQNIGMILKENGLEEYDEARLFILADGKCAQDECYISAVSKEALPENIQKRRQQRITAITYAENMSYLVSFADGSIGMLDIRSLSGTTYEERFASRIGLYRNLLENPTVTCGGAELSYDNGMGFTYPSVYEKANRLQVSEKVFCNFMQDNLLSTQDLQEKLSCSRQYISEQVRKEKIRHLDLGGRIQVFPVGEYYRMIDR